MYKVLLTDNIADAALDAFAGYDDVEAIRTGTLPVDELKEMIADCDAVVVRSPTKVTADVLAAATKLKFIGRAGVGVDNIDIEEATKRGVVVMNSPGGNTVSTAEHAIALILAVARRIPLAHQSVTKGLWERKAYRGTELNGKTLGVVGLGRVGREVARRLQAFDMEILAMDPFVDGESASSLGIKLVDLDTLLAGSDVVTVHVPLMDETRALFDAGAIAKMRDGAYLINCARGGVVSERALLDALESGKLAGAALDVYESEPPGELELFQHPRCVFTPHLGAATAEAQVRVAVEAAECVAKALTTGTTRNAVNG